MSQLDFIRDTVSDFFDALTGSNLADTGTYTAPGGSPVACRFLIKRGVAPFGDYGRAVGDNTSVRIVNSDVPAQVPKAIITVTSIALGTEQFRLLERQQDDGALTTWATERV